jgi:hypothetical protein
LITFIVRERSIGSTAIQNAALYDAKYLASLGLEVCIVSMSEHEMRMLDLPEVLAYVKTEKAKFLHGLDPSQR